MEEPEGSRNSVINNDIDRISLAPMPSTEYDDLPLIPLTETDLSSSLSDSIYDNEFDPIAADTMNTGVDDLFQEQPWENLDASLLPIPDTAIWGETQHDPITNADAETSVAQYDPQFSVNDLDEAIF